jgi:hypothetical protein
MIAYKYNAELKTYCGEHDCQVSPLEKNVFLHPDNATELKPPDVGENEIAVFAGGAWSIIDDCRGQRSYDSQGKETYIKELRELPKTAPPDTLIKPEWSNSKWVESATNADKTAREQEKINEEARWFLSETDWKTIRHTDQVSMGVATSLADAEYQALLVERQLKRESIA